MNSYMYHISTQVGIMSQSGGEQRNLGRPRTLSSYNQCDYLLISYPFTKKYEIVFRLSCQGCPDEIRTHSFVRFILYIITIIKVANKHSHKMNSTQICILKSPKRLSLMHTSHVQASFFSWGSPCWEREFLFSTLNIYI